MAKIQEMAKVLSQEEIASGVCSLWIATRIAKEAHPGQFVSLYTADATHLLPRPISICEIDAENERLHLVYRLVGAGTREFSQLKEGDAIKALGPLGNGFSLDGDHPIVIGGGIGVPPMLGLAQALSGDVTAVLGYRNDELFLRDFFEQAADVVIATDDGSIGTHGTVVDALLEKQVTGDVIYACGPKPMLAAVKKYAAAHEIPCYISMEERMACGIGACLACVCQTKEVDPHSKVHNTRICKDGPVFLAEEVEL